MIWYDTIWYDIWYDMIYGTVHVYTQTIHRTTQNKPHIEQHKHFGNNTKFWKIDFDVVRSTARNLALMRDSRIEYRRAAGIIGRLAWIEIWAGSTVSCALCVMQLGGRECSLLQESFSKGTVSPWRPEPSTHQLSEQNAATCSAKHLLIEQQADN